MLLANGYRSVKALRKQPPYNKGEVFGVPDDVAQVLMAPVPDKDGGPWVEDWPYDPPEIILEGPNAVGQAFVRAEQQSAIDHANIKAFLAEVIQPLTTLITVQQQQMVMLAEQQQHMALLLANMQQGKGGASDQR